MSGSSKRRHSDDDDALRELVSSILSGRYKEETYLWDVSSVCRARPESAPRLLALIDRYKRLGRMPAAQHQKVKARIEQVLRANQPASSKPPVANNFAAVDEEDIDGIDIDVEQVDQSDPADDLSDESMTREFPPRVPAESVRARGASIRAVRAAAASAPPTAATPRGDNPPPAATTPPESPTRTRQQRARQAQSTVAPPSLPQEPRAAVAPAPVTPAAPAPIPLEPLPVAPSPAAAPAPIAPAPVAPPVVSPSPVASAAVPLDASIAATRVMLDDTLLSALATPERSAPAGNGISVANALVTSIGLDTVLHDRYELRQLLGRGGIATVYKAVDRYRVNLGLEDCHVAVKIVQPHPARPGSVAALGREFHNAQLLSHPNVINVFNIDHAGDASYYTMELLDGERLSQLTKRLGLLPRAYALAIIRDIGAAIAHAHSRGVVHADLKPHNVMVTRTGQIRVLDFGSGLIRAREPWISEMSPDDHYRQATPAYASCEQLEGWSADPRDDIYALACLAYQLLAGKHPFDMQPSLDARARRLQPRRPPGLKGEQWRALRRGLAWTREQRTMAIEAWLKDLGVGAAAESLPPLSQLQAAKPHHPWIGRVAVAAALVAGLGLAAFAVNQHQDFDWRASLNGAEGTLNQAWQRIESLADGSDSTASAGVVTPVEAAAAPPSAPAASPVPARKSAATTTRTASATPSARSSRLASEPVADNSVSPPETVAAAASPVAAAADRAQATGGNATPALQFSAASYIVSGTEPAARIVIRRLGSTDGDVDFVWWTEEGSAKADVDYASLGRRVERIPSGTDKITVFVPIISNPRHDSTQFYVELGEPGSYNTTGPGTRSIVTIDHGN